MTSNDLVVVTIWSERISNFRGGAPSGAMYAAKALHKKGLNVMLLNLCFECYSVMFYKNNFSQLEIPSKKFPFFLNYLGQDNLKLLGIFIEDITTIYDNIIFIATDTLSLFYLLQLRRKVKTLQISRIKVFWIPGGNELTCPLHTEVCPYSNSLTKTYGHATSLSFYISKCIPHIFQSIGISLYHPILWPWIRGEIIKNVDGILAKRSVYLEGCKLLKMDKCAYIGFGVDTEKFAPMRRSNVISDNKFIELLRTRVISGNLFDLIDCIEKDQCLILGYVGAARPTWKNIELLLSSFSRIAKKYSNIKLLMIARDAYILKALLKRFPEAILSRIVIIDSIPHKEIHKAYNLIDVFINPSLLDSLEYNTLEALCSANIVLASNRGCINDLKYLLGVDILRFEPTVNSLSSLLEGVMNNIDLYKSVSRENLQHIRRILSHDAFGDRILRGLNKLNIRV